MSEISKALVPAIPGVVLVVLGAVLANDTLIAIGASLLGISPVVWRVPNRKPARKQHVRRGLPNRR